METTLKSRSSDFVKRIRKECPENLSKAGIWMQKYPQGVGVIINRRAVNK